MAHWFIAVGQAANDAHTAVLIEHKKCVMGCVGRMARLAHRQYVAPYAWIPFGYHCVECNTLYFDLDMSRVDM